MTRIEPSSVGPELLAPAGDFEAMRAAVANGANAVYFGLSDFNARYRAANFTLEELPRVMQFLHDAGVRGYVTFNTLVFSDELPRAVEYLSAVIAAGADAVIVQDLGIARLVKELAPGFAVHGSTQMTLTEPRGIEFVRRLGVERVILARELSITEIARIRKETDLPVEVFVHGALCVAYSGQCLTSESLGGRSANRGQCAQACRQPYELIVDGERRELGDKAYLLSPQDLAAYDLVDQLADIGVCSLKIEGRLKSAHYVAAATQTYRAAIDAAVSHRPFELAPQQLIDLQQSFSRGLTNGFLAGVNHQQLVQGRFPKNRGVHVGSVIRKTDRSVTVQLDDRLLAAGDNGGPLVPLKPGDGVVFDEGRPEQDEQGGRVYAVRTIASHERRSKRVEIEIEFGRGAVNFAAIEPGAIVWRTDDPALRKRLERSVEQPIRDYKIPVSVRVSGANGEPLRTVWSTLDGISIEESSADPLESARKHPLTVAVVREQFGRLGDTPFELAEVTQIDASNQSVAELPVMVPKSVLNGLRRQATASLAAARRAADRPRIANPDALATLRSRHREKTPEAESTRTDKATRTEQFSVLVRSAAQLTAVLDWSPSIGSKPSLVYCDFEEVRLSRQAVLDCRAAGMQVAIATPRVIKPAELGLLKQVAACHPDAVLVRNLTAVEFFRYEHPGIEMLGDYSLNVANDLTADILWDSGLKQLTPSYDLNLQQLQSLLESSDPSRFEVVLHQHMPMFHMEHCVFSHVLSNGTDFHSCGRPCDRHQVELRDHVGESHPLQADVGCRNTVFNAHAQSAAPYLPRLRTWGIRRFRMELLRETPSEAVALLEKYAKAITGSDSPPGVWRELKVLNQLGVTRGTLEFA